MAFSIRKREEKHYKSDMGLLDAALMQDLQERFCDANNVYLACISKKHGVVTKAYGSKEELNYIHKYVNMDMHVSLLNKLIESDIESVVEENCGTNLIKMCGVAVRVGGEIIAIWIVIGVMEGAEGEEEVPPYIMRTTEEHFYKSLEFLETLSKQLFAVKLEENLAQEAFLRSRESESQMEAELHRNEVMTSIVKMLESENGFTKIVDDILLELCEYLKVSNGALLRENVGHDTVDMICEYVSAEAEEKIGEKQNVPKELLPFFNGKPYMISSNSMMPDEFHRMFERDGIKAGVFLPIDVNGRASMYFCLYETINPRVWEVNDIKFMNDVKRIIQSILLKRIAKNSLASSYASLEAILENVGCGIYVKDPGNGNVLYTNQRFRDSFQNTQEKDNLDKCLATIADGLSDGKFQEVGSTEGRHWYDICSTDISWVDGRNVVLYTIYDVTENVKYQKKIERQANNDFLTGLYNRMRAEQDLERYIQQIHEVGGEGALLYIDLDDFKNINDALGHQQGDILLKNIAASLQKISGVEESCYRVGGDEFLILISHHHYALMQRIIDEVRQLFLKPWLLKGTEYYCTMSMGVVRFPTDGDTVEELIKKADIALYDAKCDGKNRVAFYNDGVASASYKRLDTEKNMRNAVKNCIEEFEVYYQPIVDILKPDMPCIGAEALVRWNSSALGFVSPADFIPLAEYLGLINPIGEHVLREACSRCKYWNDMGHPDYKINVNLSIVQLLQKDIVETIENVLDETRILPQNLTLEVTESLAINDMNKMKQVLADIRKLGVCVALDDFGTGYSSLNHIREMPIDVIKIDRCFIIDIEKDEFSNAFVKMVSELANTIGVKVCVEGVEREEQLHLLMDGKVQMIQGYYFGKPFPVEVFEEKYM